MDTLIQVENLKKYFDEKLILKDLSFYLDKGEIVGFLGPNGAGKSTTIRSLIGIYSYDSGKIQFNTTKKNTVESIGYLPEERGMYKTVTVEDMLLYFAELKNYPKKQAKNKMIKHLKKFKLENQLHTKIQNLSKGMSQKIQFIASIIHEPEILILDEPFSGLDPISQTIFKEEIKNLAKKGTGIFFSSHQMNVVEEMCDRVYLLNKGEFVLSGPLEDIKKEHGGYVCSITKPKEDIQTIKKNLPETEKIETDEKTIRIHFSNQIKKQDILNKISKLNFEEIKLEHASLHDIYIKLIGENNK